MIARVDKPMEDESALVASLQRAYIHSTFWSSRLSANGVKEGDLRIGFEYHNLPLLTKQDLVHDQLTNPPFGSLLAVTADKVVRVHKTSGTTSHPFIIALTNKDIEDTCVASSRAFKAAGLKKEDFIVHCLNFNMWSGGVSDYLSLERIGATCVPYGTGNTEMLLNLIQSLSINAISSTPSYMYTLMDRCVDTLNIEPKDLGLRKGFFGGEGLLQVPHVREEIEEAFRMTAYDANYGLSEVLSVIAGEDAHRNGMVYHAHGMLYTELIDAGGSTLPIIPGAKGELVYSTLRREAQPLFRYRSHDFVEILDAVLGDDGLLRMKFKLLGRSDEMLIIKGVNFFPQSLESVVSRFAPEISRNYLVYLDRDKQSSPMKILLEASIPEGKQRIILAKRIIKSISNIFQIKVEIRWVPLGGIVQSGNKKKYLLRETDSLYKAVFN